MYWRDWNARHHHTEHCKPLHGTALQTSFYSAVSSDVTSVLDMMRKLEDYDDTDIALKQGMCVDRSDLIAYPGKVRL